MGAAAADRGDQTNLNRDLLAESARLRSLARSLCRGNEDQADDLVQETYAIALGNRSTEVASNFGAWCRGVLRNRFRERARRNKRRFAREQIIARARLEAVNTEVEARVERAELLERLVKFVLALDAPYRDILLQRYFEGRSLVEIAEHDALPLDTIRTRHRRALGRLRDRLDADAGGDRSRWILGLTLATGCWPREAAASGVSHVTTHASGTAAVLILGVFAMKKMIYAIIFAAILLGGGFIGWTSWRDGGDDSELNERSREFASDDDLESSASDLKDHSEGLRIFAAGDETENATKVSPVEIAVEAAHIVGIVRDRVGTPLAGVRVDAALVKKPDFFSPVLEVVSTTTTAKNGEFVLGELAPGTYFARAIHAEWRPEQVRDLVLAAGDERWIEFQMTRGLGISGIVVDKDGAAIAGATVETTPAFEQYGAITFGIGSESHDWAREEMRATTGSDGAFRLGRLNSGNHRVVARHADWAIAVLPKIAASSESLTIVMTRGSRVQGRVIGADGVPLEGARLTFELYEDRFIARAQWRRHGKSRSDADGRFAFPNASPGRSILEVLADGLPRRVIEIDVPDADAQPLELEIRLGAGATLRGRLVDGEGSAISAAKVFLDSTEGAYYSKGVDSEDDGTFLFEGIERDLEYRVLARDSRYLSPEPLTVRVLDAEVDLGDIRLERGNALRGRVVTAEGQAPITQAKIMLERESGAGSDGQTIWRGAHRDTRSDSDGVFDFGGLGTETYRVVVQAAGIGVARSEPVAVEEGGAAEELVIAMGDGPKLSGRVVDDRGSPVVGARVVIGEQVPQGEVVAWSDREGKFRFEHVDCRVIWIRAEADTLESETHGVVPGDTVELVLSRTASIVGGVMDAVSRKPLREFRVYLDRSRGTDHGHGDVFSQPEGLFELSDVPPGDYVLSVRAQGYLAYEVDLSLLAAERREVEVALRPALELRGRIIDDDGMPLEGAEVVALESGQPPVDRLRGGAMMLRDRGGRNIAVKYNRRRADAVLSDRDGMFAIDVAPDSNLTISVWAADRLGVTHGPVHIDDRTIDVGEIYVERGAGGRGTVVLASGEARGGGTIAIDPVDSEGVKLEGKTRYVQIGSDGSFEFSGLLPGAYRVKVFGADETRTELDLDPDEKVSIEFRLGPERRR